MIALILGDDNRIKSACTVIPNTNYGVMPIVDTLPKGNLPDYLYTDGEFVYDPLPTPEEPDPQPTQEERITALEAQLAAYESAFAEGVSEGWA